MELNRPERITLGVWESERLLCIRRLERLEARKAVPYVTAVVHGGRLGITYKYASDPVGFEYAGTTT